MRLPDERGGSWAAQAGVVLGIASLVLSAYVAYAEDRHFEQLTRPRSEHDEVLDEIQVLDQVLRAQEGGLPANASDPRSLSARENLSLARQEWLSAVENWTAGNFAAANQHVLRGYEDLRRIGVDTPRFTPVQSEQAWPGSPVLVVAAVILGSTAIALGFHARRRRRDAPHEPGSRLR